MKIQNVFWTRNHILIKCLATIRLNFLYYDLCQHYDGVTVKWNHCPCFDQNETEIAESIYHLAFEEDFARAEASGPNLIKLLKALYTFGNYSKYILA